MATLTINYTYTRLSHCKQAIKQRIPTCYSCKKDKKQVSLPCWLTYKNYIKNFPRYLESNKVSSVIFRKCYDKAI